MKIKIRAALLAGSLGLMPLNISQAIAVPTVNELLPTSSTHARDLVAKEALPQPFFAPVPSLSRISQQPSILAAAPLADDAEELDTVTVTATLRRTKIRDNPGSIYVIDQKEMQQKGARTVGDALRNVPGVVSNLFGQGADVHSTYFIRGLPTTSTALLIDGRSINNINQEHVDLNELPVAGIERIEVLTGGATLLYGSTAVGGAINIITKRPPKVAQGNTEVTFGSYGYSDYRVSYGGPLTENFRINAFASIFKTAADYYYEVDRSFGKISGIRKSGAVDSNTYGFDADWDIDSRNSLSFSSYYRQGGRGITLFALEDQRQGISFVNPNITDPSDPLFGTRTASANQLGLNETLIPRLTLDYYGGAITLNKKIGATENSGSDLQVRVSYDRGRTTEVAFDEANTTDVGVFNFRAGHAWQVSPGYNLTYGFDFIQENGRAFSAENPLIYQANTDKPSLFLLNTLNLADNLILTAGLRSTFGSTAAGNQFNRSFEGSLDPSVGVRWQVLPSFGLRSTYSRVFKTPNFNDLFATGEIKGNPGLVSEKGSTFDVGFDWKPGSTSLLRFSFFANDIQNLLGYNLIEQGNAKDEELSALYGYELNDRVRVNFPSVKTSGFELSANWQFVPNWTLFATETYTDARIQEGFKEAYNGTQYPLVPFHSGRVGISY
ncbi:MAG: TonB-dependent receptor, partial [Anaerolineae bacterium]|nr:TonB-dependent receptor [Gloeobacterales cyanobacterium ES-bin-313]